MGSLSAKKINRSRTGHTCRSAGVSYEIFNLAFHVQGKTIRFQQCGVRSLRRRQPGEVYQSHAELPRLGDFGLSPAVRRPGAHRPRIPRSLRPPGRGHQTSPVGIAEGGASAGGCGDQLLRTEMLTGPGAPEGGRAAAGAGFSAVVQSFLALTCTAAAYAEVGAHHPPGRHPGFRGELVLRLRV